MVEGERCGYETEYYVEVDLLHASDQESRISAKSVAGRPGEEDGLRKWGVIVADVFAEAAAIAISAHRKNFSFSIGGRRRYPRILVVEKISGGEKNTRNSVYASDLWTATGIASRIRDRAASPSAPSSVALLSRSVRALSNFSLRILRFSKVLNLNHDTCRSNVLPIFQSFYQNRFYVQGSDPRVATCRGKLQNKRSKLNQEINKELRLRAGAENLFK